MQLVLLQSFFQQEGTLPMLQRSVNSIIRAEHGFKDCLICNHYNIQVLED